MHSQTKRRRTLDLFKIASGATQQRPGFPVNKPGVPAFFQGWHPDRTIIATRGLTIEHKIQKKTNLTGNTNENKDDAGAGLCAGFE